MILTLWLIASLTALAAWIGTHLLAQHRQWQRPIPLLDVRRPRHTRATHRRSA